jgi:hypothetical protein
MGRTDEKRAGDIDVTSYDLRSGTITRSTLHHETEAAQRQRWRDDHCCPALLVRPDGRLLAVYAPHGLQAGFCYRISREPGSATAWGEERMFPLSASSRVAFPTLVALAGERQDGAHTLLFFRGLDNRLMPAWAHSADAGEAWTTGGMFMRLSGKATPYVKYASDGRATVHVAFTDGHRMDFGNGLYHAIWRGDQLSRSDGTRIGSVAEAITSTRQPTEIFRSNADSVAMISDLALDGQGHPCVVYSVQMNTRPLRPRPVGADHRYRYARWDGKQWHDREIAFAGTETHDAPDDDCTGLAALDPQDAKVIYISTNADPVSGAPFVSAADGKRHWELFRGTTRDGGEHWTWQAVTRNSTADNLRPIVPPGGKLGRSPVLWLRGSMRMPKDSALEVVLLHEQN